MNVLMGMEVVLKTAVILKDLMSVIVEMDLFLHQIKGLVTVRYYIRHSVCVKCIHEFLNFPFKYYFNIAICCTLGGSDLIYIFYPR